MQRYFNAAPKQTGCASGDSHYWPSVSLLDQQTARSIAKDLLENRLGKTASANNIELLAAHLIAFDQKIESSNCK